MKAKINYYKILKYSLIPINLLLILTFILNYFKLLPAFWKSIYVFYLALIIDITFLALRIKQISENKRESHIIVYFSKYLFLLSLIVLALNQFLKRQIIFDNLSYIIGLSIAFGFLTFFSSKNEAKEGLVQEKTQEENNEARRKEEFGSRFSRINKLPILSKIVRRMYQEGWSYSLSLILILIVGSSFYFYGLGNYGFQGDEYYHATVANVFFESGKLFSLGNQSYTRSPLTSLLPIGSKYFFTYAHISATNEFIYRFPIAVLSIISIIFIYLIAKLHLPKKYSLLITLLYTTEIWFIYFARFLR